MKFLIAIETGTESTTSGVVVPALPGCFSAAILWKKRSTTRQRRSKPFARSWQRMAKTDVQIERYFGSAEKINITVPGRVLSRIDDYAKRRGLSRSGFLVQAAQEAMTH